MKVGILGAGKLGGPVALTFESQGHELLVCDKAEWVDRAFRERKWPHLEKYVNELLTFSKIRNVKLEELVRHSEILFIAVQTPHEHKYGGAVPLPDDRKDFDYQALVQATQEVQGAINATGRGGSPPTVAVISTVLPGTTRREILPHLADNTPFVYCPFFAAMGTVVEDVLNPEFVLLGSEEEDPFVENSRVEKISNLFLSFKNKSPLRYMSIESAELTKVCYNLWLSNKIVLANTVMEICHKTPGANCDDVMDAIKLSNKRIVAPTYMTSGMGDGGNCLTADTLISLLDGREVPVVIKLSNKRIVAPTYMTSGMGDGGNCLTADTLISLLDGREVPVVDLVDIDEFYVYSYDLKTKRVVPGRGHSCRLTNSNADILEITLDNGKIIKCTKDHPFLLRDGCYSEASNLMVGTRLMPLYRWLDAWGYERLSHPGEGKEHTHRMVYRNKFGRKSSKLMGEAHHKNHNKLDNRPENIDTIMPSEHSSYHNNTPERLEQQSNIIKKLNEEGKINNEEHRNKTRYRNITNNPMKDEATRNKMGESLSITLQKQVEEGTHHTVTNNPAYKLIEEGRHNFQTQHPMKDPEKKAKMIVKLNDTKAKEAGFTSHEESLMVVNRMRDEGLTINEIANKLSVSLRFVRYRLGLNNHKVISIVETGKADVYNFEVDEYENYAVGAGVFIHNCHPRDLIAMSWLGDELDLSANIFDAVMQAREEHTRWLVDLFIENSEDLPLVILGKAYKPNTNLVDGSAGLLCGEFLSLAGLEYNHFDPYIDKGVSLGFLLKPAAFLITTKHPEFTKYNFPSGSIIVDPFRMIPKSDNYKVIQVGVGL